MSNPFIQFLDLIPKTPRQVATIVSGADGFYTAQLLTGQLIQVKSQSTFNLNTKVFVKDGIIETAAPDLPFIEIEV